MSFNPDVVYQKLVNGGDDWSEKEAAASLLEENKKTLISQLAQRYINDHQATSMAQAESLALASKEYGEHIEQMVKARKEANKAKVRYFSIQTWTELIRTKEATRRIEAKLEGSLVP